MVDIEKYGMIEARQLRLLTPLQPESLPTHEMFSSTHPLLPSHIARKRMLQRPEA